MSWNLEGMRVFGKYMGSIPVSGIVDFSRVRYGGEVSHHVVLDEPIEVYGAVRERVILEHKHVERVTDTHTDWSDIGCEFDPKVV